MVVISLYRHLDSMDGMKWDASEGNSRFSLCDLYLTVDECSAEDYPRQIPPSTHPPSFTKRQAPKHPFTPPSIERLHHSLVVNLRPLYYSIQREHRNTSTTHTNQDEPPRPSSPFLLSLRHQRTALQSTEFTQSNEDVRSDNLMMVNGFWDEG